MKKIISVFVLLIVIVTYFLLPNNQLGDSQPQLLEKSKSLEADSVVNEYSIDELEPDSNTITYIKPTIENVKIDSMVFATQILPPIKKYHQKLFNEDYGKDTISFKPGDIVEIYSDGDYRYVKATAEYNNRTVETYRDSTYTIIFNILETADRKDVFYEGKGHSVAIPIGSYINCYNNTSLLEDDFDYDGNDDLLITTYWYFGGAGGSQTKFLFLKKDGKYKLAYEDDMVYKSSCFMGSSTQDGYDYSENGILFGSVSEYGEGSAGCCPSHFYNTETKFIDGEFKTIKKTLTRHLVKGEDGRWDYVVVGSDG